ncbi:MAG: efflux RND transporter periplasmic adaptor subunit [Geobacter sp.]|nr:efflux RND transporter periplasmic adaptor subunit [Geobacter sp.]
MKKILIPVIILLLAAVGVYFYTKRPAEAAYRTAKVERGPIISSVSATGTLSAVVTVQVGTQVSGTIQKILVDYNSPVKRGQVIAQIDPALLGADVEQTRGSYLSAEANLQKAKATAADTRRTMERNRQLVRDGVVSQGDFDTAETRYQEAVAAVKSAEASVIQTRGTYSRAQTNLNNATIRSPVNGVVVSRSVDVGQTVAASFQTPTLFTIAQDLTRMQIDTSVDEADIGRIKLGQPVTFTVDAYPEEKFAGRVSQVRNAPIIAQNVVTYTVVILVDNKELKLKPGMTANVTIETMRKENVLKLPMTALRFKPKDESAGKGKPSAPVDKTAMKRVKDTGQKAYILSPDKKPVPVPIKTGIGNDTHVEVTEGKLNEGDEVIIEQVMAKKEKKAGGMPMGPRF